MRQSAAHRYINSLLLLLLLLLLLSRSQAAHMRGNAVS